MVATPKPERGGSRAPLQPLVIFIPKFKKYQEPAAGGQRRWAATHRGIGRNEQIRQACAITRNTTPLAVFVVLLTLADNQGHVTGHTAKDLAYEILGIDYRSVLSALDALASATDRKGAALIKVGANAEQAPSKRRQLEELGDQRDVVGKTNADLSDDPGDSDDSRKDAIPQVEVVQRANIEQTSAAHLKLEESASDAVSGDRPHITVPNGTYNHTEEREIEVNPEGSIPPPGVSPFPTSAVDLISQAMAARNLPARGADAMAFYKAEAHGIVSRKTPNVTNQVWANWACMAIAAVAADDVRWMAAVNTTLKTSKMAGNYVPPESSGGASYGKQANGASQRLGVRPGGNHPSQPGGIRDVRL